MIMQDGINDNNTYKFNSKYSNYTYTYYTNSEIKTPLELWYDENIGNDSNLSSKVTSGDYYCEQFKAKYPNWDSGNAVVPQYGNYVSSFKCETDGNDKGIVNATIGLLSLDEALFAGNYYYMQSNSYLNSDTVYNMWIMSPSGAWSGSVGAEWSILNTGKLNPEIRVDHTAILKPVINLKADTKFTGNGTLDNMYMVK